MGSSHTRDCNRAFQVDPKYVFNRPEVAEVSISAQKAVSSVRVDSLSKPKEVHRDYKYARIGMLLTVSYT